MSHNTLMTIADKLQLVPSHGTHHCHFLELPFPHLNSDVIKSQPCSLFSISLASCSCPSLHCCVSYLYALPCCVSSCTSDIPTNALFPDSIYKTLFMYDIQYVQISMLIIVLIVYSTSGHSNITLNF